MLLKIIQKLHKKELAVIIGKSDRTVKDTWMLCRKKASSEEKTANATVSGKYWWRYNTKTMAANYFLFHSMDPQMAVDDLKEIYRQKNQ